MVTLTLIALWVFCGILAYGFINGDWMDAYPGQGEQPMAIFIALFGPIGLMVGLLMPYLTRGRVKFKIF